MLSQANFCEVLIAYAVSTPTPWRIRVNILCFSHSAELKISFEAVFEPKSQNIENHKKCIIFILSYLMTPFGFWFFRLVERSCDCFG